LEPFFCISRAFLDVLKSFFGRAFLNMDGQQAGDPEKAAAAIINVAYQENPPLHLLLGADAYDRAMAQLEKLEKEFRFNEELSKSMAYSA
jgi:hypothetical protein